MPLEDSIQFVYQVLTLWALELTCSGWVHSPYCSTRRPTQGSGRALGLGLLETGSPRHCSGTQPGYGRIPVSQRRGGGGLSEGQPSIYH